MLLVRHDRDGYLLRCIGQTDWLTSALKTNQTSSHEHGGQYQLQSICLCWPFYWDWRYVFSFFFFLRRAWLSFVRSEASCITSDVAQCAMAFSTCIRILPRCSSHRLKVSKIYFLQNAPSLFPPAPSLSVLQLYKLRLPQPLQPFVLLLHHKIRCWDECGRENRHTTGSVICFKALLWHLCS